MNTKIKAVLFDMDGVLIDAKDWHYEALNLALDYFGHIISRDDHLKIFDGLPTSKKLEILSKSVDLPKQLHPLINNLKQKFFIQIANIKCKPEFSKQFVMHQLKKNQIKIAVCSNSVRKSVKLMMELSKLDPYIDLMLSNEDVEFPKPNPEIYLRAIEYFRLEAKECLIVEDNENGIIAAKSSGANVMVVDSVQDVTYSKIKEIIWKLEGEN